MRFHEWFETIYIEIVLIARHVLIERDFFLLISREKLDKKYKSIFIGRFKQRVATPRVHNALLKYKRVTSKIVFHTYKYSGLTF